MCGFVGISKKNKISQTDIHNISDISKKIYHRGPDQYEDWISENKKIFLSHRRLAINDLSKDGIQPMISNSKRFTLVFNGEIYNFREIKKNLLSQGFSFKGNSDTEVLLNLIDVYGINYALKYVSGMYSLGLFDAKLNKFYLSRDPSGQKPLYYYKDDEMFFFTSEIRDIQKIGIKKKISLEALQYYFQLSYIPSPLSIYENVFKLPKGKYLELDLENFIFKINDIKNHNKTYDLSNKNFDQKINNFEKIFFEVIDDYLVSDVTNGTLLSGGIDSTIISHFSNSVSKNKINSYCVKSNDVNFDESVYASQVAKSIGTNHHTLEFSFNDLYEAIINIHKVYDEPFGDSSQIPTFLLFKSIKNNIKVALSGDGGDEIFLGYNRYLFLNNHYQTLKNINYRFRGLISHCINFFPEKLYDNLNYILGNKYFNFGNKMSKISTLMGFRNLKELYFQIVRQDHNYQNLVKIKSGTRKNYLENLIFLDNLSNLENFQRADINTYLPDDIFVKVDRASMHCSIESRAPFLDDRIINFANQLDVSDKITKNSSKFFLKNYLKQNYPKLNFDRPKMGFGNPIGLWLNNELRTWADELINYNNESIEEFINIELIKEIWRKHQKQKRDYSNIIWNFLVFKQWFVFNEIN